jgi:outer membrane protein OmpA-like peptidoglycan-associated protein
VHFPIASDEFDAEAREEMVAVARSGLLTRADSILLTGRSSPSGSRDANQKLANRRALAVKAILLKAGVQESVISLNEYDCCIEEKSSSTQDMREMRRVDINITARSQ